MDIDLTDDCFEPGEFPKVVPASEVKPTDTAVLFPGYELPVRYQLGWSEQTRLDVKEPNPNQLYEAVYQEIYDYRFQPAPDILYLSCEAHRLFQKIINDKLNQVGLLIWTSDLQADDFLKHGQFTELILPTGHKLYLKIDPHLDQP